MLPLITRRGMRLTLGAKTADSRTGNYRFQRSYSLSTKMERVVTPTGSRGKTPLRGLSISPMIELLLANWIWFAAFHFCTHEVPIIGLAIYGIYRYFRPKKHECCTHDGGTHED